MDGDKYVFLFIDCLAGWGWLDLQDGWIELARRGVAGIDLRACESLGNYCQMIRFSKTHLIRFSFSKQVLCNTTICFSSNFICQR